MTRRFQGLNQTVKAASAELAEGLYLVRVDKAQYRRHSNKPFYVLRFSVMEPQEFAGQIISGRLYCTTKALWKLGWFLRDFGYDAELLGHDEVDEKVILGLHGVVKISQTRVNGASMLNLEGFASPNDWPRLSPTPTTDGGAVR